MEKYITDERTFSSSTSLRIFFSSIFLHLLFSLFFNKEPFPREELRNEVVPPCDFCTMYAFLWNMHISGCVAGAYTLVICGVYQFLMRNFFIKKSAIR